MDEKEIKDALTAVKEINGHWENQKKAIDTMHNELKETGKVSGETKELCAKLETKMAALEKHKERLENLEKFAKSLAERKTEEKEIDPADRKEAKAAFARFIRDGENSTGGASPRFKWEGANKDGKKSMSIISDPDGGYMTTTDMSGEVVKKVWETSPVRQVASVQTISKNALEGGTDRDEAGAEWDTETQTPSDTKTPQIGKYKIPVHELRARTLATSQFLEDADIDVESWLAQKQADKFSRTENSAFVTGDGVSKPRGFLTYPVVAVGAFAWGSVEYVPTGFASVISADALIAVEAALKDFYRKNASWSMTRTSIGAVRTLKDNYGQYLWQPGLTLSQPAMLLGHPVNEFADMPEVAANALSIAFADFKSCYQIVDRLGLQTLRDPFTSQPYVKFITRKRVGGDVKDFDAIKVVKVAVS